MTALVAPDMGILRSSGTIRASSGCAIAAARTAVVALASSVQGIAALAYSSLDGSRPLSVSNATE